MKVFVDTNVILDVLERREPFYLHSTNILDLGNNCVIELYTSALSLINVLYVCRKSIGKENAIARVQELRTFLSISPITSDEFDNALSIGNKDIEDNLQFCSAVTSECEVLVTRNKSDFPVSDEIKVQTPVEFLYAFCC